MDNTASVEKSKDVEIDLASLQIAFAQAVIQRHMETHPTLEGMAEIWISKSAFMVYQARIAGLQSLVNFLSMKHSNTSRREQKILAGEIQRLQENVMALEAIPHPQGYYLWGMSRLINSRPASDILPIKVGEAKPNLHSVTMGANDKLAKLKTAWKSGFSGVQKWLLKS